MNLILKQSMMMTFRVEYDLYGSSILNFDNKMRYEE